MSSETRSRGVGSVILRGASWTTLAQLTPLIINILMTPYIIHGFGIDRYGLFLLCNTVVLFLGSFDGGISSSVARYAAVYAGTDDRRAATRMVTSLFVLVLAAGVLLFAVLYGLAPEVLRLFHAPARLQPEGTFLLRTMAGIIAFAQVRGLFAGQLTGRQLYRLQALTSLASYGVYAIGLLITIRGHHGLRGVAYTFVAQAVVATVFLVPRSLTFLDKSSIKLMPKRDLYEFLGYSMRVQATGLTSVFTAQADTFIVARLLTIKDVAIFGAGSNFATQLRNVPINALGPISTSLSQAYGRGGDAEAVAVFARLQRRWVQATTAWCATAIAACYFAVPAWLGPNFNKSGLVACILMLANAVNLWTGALTALLIAVGRPGLETRYLIVAVAINVTLTIPLVIVFGLIGTVVATAVGTAVSSLYLVRIARHRYREDLPSFVREVPLTPALCAIVVVTVLEILIRPYVPNGGVGLILSGLAAAPGLAVFGLVLFGPSETRRLVRVRLLRRQTEISV